MDSSIAKKIPGIAAKKLASLISAAETRLRRMEEGNLRMMEQLMHRLAIEDLRELRQGLIALAEATVSTSPSRRRSA